MPSDMDGVMESDVEGWNSSGHDDNVSEMEEASDAESDAEAAAEEWRGASADGAPPAEDDDDDGLEMALAAVMDQR